MRAARALAARRRDPAVELAHVTLAVATELDTDLREAFDAAGWRASGVEALLGDGGAPGAVVEAGHLFHAFDERAKRALSAAAKAAQHEGARAISPAHVLLAALQAAPEIQRAAELSAARARLLLHGRSVDATAPEGGPLAPDDALVAYLDGVGADADTLALLGRFHGGVTPELADVLLRHKVTPALLARVRGSFCDPE
jgi:ATP-dependent Clp protease ATP-binding subunit ClpA